MSRVRDEQGIALMTTIILMAVMLVMGAAILGIVVTQANQTTEERVGESAFNLAEATLNAEAFLLGRSWPQTVAHTQAGTTTACGTPAQTLTDNLTTPGTTVSLNDQVQSVLAQTYDDVSDPTASQWWVSACEEGTRNAWDAGLLNGLAYDPSVALDSTPQPRRMWVRAEARVDGVNRAVVGLVQAGQQPVFPANLAVVTGTIGADLRTTANNALTGNVVGPLLTNLLGGSGKPYDGNVGLRCSLLDEDQLFGAGLVPGCLSGIYKATSMTTISPLLQGNDYVEFGPDETISEEKLVQLRQRAKLTNTYYSSVADEASCLPAASAGKVIFIEQVGTGAGAGSGTCRLNTSGGARADALVVVSGGVRVVRALPPAAPNACPAASAVVPGANGTFTGVIYAMHGKVPLIGGAKAADVRIECGSKVYGGVFVDDNPDLGDDKHGKVEVIPAQINLSTAISTLPICQNLLTRLVCSLASTLTGTLDNLLTVLGVSATTLAANIVPQLNASFPAVTYDESVVENISTFGDSAVVTGTFREVQPRY